MQGSGGTMEPVATRSWRAVEHGIEIETSGAFWQSDNGERLALVIDDWLALGLVETDGSATPATVLLRAELWLRLCGAEGGIDEEYRSLFDSLVPTERFSHDVRFISYIGAMRLPVELRRNGEVVDAGASPAVRFPYAALLTPEAFAIERAVYAWNARENQSTAEQYELLSSLRNLKRLSVARGEEVDLDRNQESVEIIPLKSLRLAWDVSQRRADMYDLQAFPEGTSDDGTAAPLDLNGIDSERPLLNAGNRVYLLEPDTAEALRHIQHQQQSRSRRDVQRVIHDPAAALPMGCAPDSIDLSEYSHRIAGFEEITRAVRKEDIQSSGIAWYSNEPRPEGQPFLELDITSEPTQPPVRLTFDTPEDVEDASSLLKRELERERPSVVQLGGANVVPTEPLRDHLTTSLALHRQTRAEPPTEPREPVVAPPRLAAVIDEDARIEPDESEQHIEAVPWQRLEGLLRPGVALKDHQRKGVAWLWYHFNRKCPGVLLADDMGVGKTFQAACLMMLANDARREPRPSLIVAPVILLNNWVDELHRFFRPEAVGRVVVLHGDELNRTRSGNGIALERLREADVVITNYETLARYQLALLKVDWHVVLLDEAHAIKNTGTLRSRAACGLKRGFAVCMTGTPVENRLLDLWSLFFFLSPHDPFGAANDFVAHDADGPRYAREALRYGSWDSRVLRRTKNEVLELLPKHIHRHAIPMSPHQARMEREIAQSSHGTLKKLDLLRKLYAHPLLFKGREGVQDDWSLDFALSESPKLKRCIDLLEEVRQRGEKALVFSQFHNMQLILTRALRSRFGIHGKRVINGDANQSGQTQTILADFASTPGFDVLILSPLAAGVGLTIVAANHVIHYDRWWNPAKEDQATDRAYRIGQTREVNVHYLLLHRPESESEGFDMRLHELVEHKRSRATEFLAPSDEADMSEGELARLFGEATR